MSNYAPTALFNSNVSPVPFLGGPDKAEAYDIIGDGAATTISVVPVKVRVIEGIIWTGNALTADAWASDGNVPPTLTATTSAAMTSGKHGTLIIFGK